MKRIILSVLLCLSAPALAEEEEAEVCGASETTLDLRDCVKAELAAEDRRLNAIYRDLIALLNMRDKEQDRTNEDSLRRAQRAWVAFRDADCEFAGKAMEGGTFEIVLQLQCRLTHTSARNQQLEDLRAMHFGE